MTCRPLCVLIPTVAGGPLLLRAVAACLADGAERVLIIAADPTIGALPAGVEALRLPRRTPFAPAINAGLAEVGPDEDVLLLNDDAAPLPGCLPALRAAARVPGLYQPRLLFDDGSGLVENLGHRLFLDGSNHARGRGQPDPGPAPGRVPIGAASGAALFIAAAARARLGPLWGDLGAFGEDLDYALRAARLGLPVALVPAAAALHRLGASHGRAGPGKVYDVERNRLRVAARSLPLSLLLTSPLWTVHRYAHLSRAALRGEGLGAAAGPLGGAAALLGLARGLADLPEALALRAADRPGWVRGERAMLRHIFRALDRDITKV